MLLRGGSVINRATLSSYILKLIFSCYKNSLDWNIEHTFFLQFFICTILEFSGIQLANQVSVEGETELKRIGVVVINMHGYMVR